MKRMKAKCSRCGKLWQVSVKADIKRYVCPHCWSREQETKKSPTAATERGSNKKSK